MVNDTARPSPAPPRSLRPALVILQISVILLMAENAILFGVLTRAEGQLSRLVGAETRLMLDHWSSGRRVPASWDRCE